jgi:hypothetical protein
MRPPIVDFERAKAGATKADKRNGELSTTLSPLFPALGCGPPRQDHFACTHSAVLLCFCAAVMLLPPRRSHCVHCANRKRPKGA